VSERIEDGHTIASDIAFVRGDKYDDDMRRAAVRLCDEAERLKAALETVDAIRNSIVGRQGVSWSKHIYPLVEALDEAGFGGEGYDVARPKAEAEVAEVQARIDKAEKRAETAERERDVFRRSTHRLTERTDALAAQVVQVTGRAAAAEQERDALRRELDEMKARRSAKEARLKALGFEDPTEAQKARGKFGP
jgi:DNA repair exonuclease SbcCD ATPase subunit